MAITLPPSMKPVSDFVIQVVVGAFLFSVVLVAAAAIAAVVYLLGLAGFSPRWFKEWAVIGEKVLFFADLFSFGLFLLSEVAKFARSLFREWST